MNKEKRKGNYKPWNKGLCKEEIEKHYVNGFAKPLLGKKLSKETREKLSIIRKKKMKENGYLNSLEVRKKMSESHKGKKLSKETKNKMSITRNKFGTWNKDLNGKDYKKHYRDGFFDRLHDETHPAWKGGKRDYHQRRARSKVEKKLGIKLKDGQVVHHIDHNKINDNIENLHVFNSQSEHMKYHCFLRNLVREALISKEFLS